MNRQLGVTRIFALGNYENLQVTDTITDIPEDVLLNKEAVGLLRYLQLLDLELTFVQYGELRAETPRLKSEEDVVTAKSIIEEKRTITFDKLLETLKK